MSTANISFCVARETLRTVRAVKALVRALSAVSDFRIDRRKRHRLVTILVIGVMCMLSYGSSFRDMEAYGKKFRARAARRERLGGRRVRVPRPGARGGEGERDCRDPEARQAAVLLRRNGLPNEGVKDMRLDCAWDFDQSVKVMFGGETEEVG